MIVFAESNFVLELAFHRDEHASCEALLEMAEDRRIELALPAYCLVEPYEVLIRRAKSRKDLQQALTHELNDLKRSAPYAQSANEMAVLSKLLGDVIDEEKERLPRVQSRVLSIASIIPIERNTLERALTLQAVPKLPPQDSVVYAAVISQIDQDKRLKCFVTTNRSDFLLPGIEAELAAHDCKLLFKFSDALQYIGHKLGI